MRLTIALFVAAMLCGCRHQGQQVVDPFWGRQTVPPPCTGSVGTAVVYPGCPPTGTVPPINPAATIPGGTAPGAPPNLLPGPASLTPSTSAAPAAPAIPPTPGTTGTGSLSGSGSLTVTPPPGAASPSPVAPPSGYGASATSPGAATLGTPSPNNATSPPDRYGAPPTSPGVPAYPPSVGSPAPSGSGSAAPLPGAITTPPPSGYLPPDGSMNYRGGQWQPQGEATTTVADGTKLNSGPSVIRIPASAAGSGSATPASATLPEK